MPDLVSPNLVQIRKVSHIKALEFMSQSDVLLLIHPNNGWKGVYTGKLFEYSGMLRPIIALIDKSDVAAKLIKDCRAGYVADSDNIEEISHIILQAYNDWKSGTRLNYNVELIKSLHRKEQVKILGELIDVLC